MQQAACGDVCTAQIRLAQLSAAPVAGRGRPMGRTRVLTPRGGPHETQVLRAHHAENDQGAITALDVVHCAGLNVSQVSSGGIHGEAAETPVVDLQLCLVWLPGVGQPLNLSALLVGQDWRAWCIHLDQTLGSLRYSRIR